MLPVTAVIPLPVIEYETVFTVTPGESVSATVTAPTSSAGLERCEQPTIAALAPSAAAAKRNAAFPTCVRIIVRSSI
jgi:hypothetical protein